MVDFLQEIAKKAFEAFIIAVVQAIAVRLIPKCSKKKNTTLTPRKRKQGGKTK